MRRELLLEKIDELKELMPWYVLEYYQSKLTVPYSFTTLYEYLKEYRRFFEWLINSGVSDANKLADIPLETLEHLSKKDMESFILYLRERTLLNTKNKRQGVSQTTINRTLSALSSLYKYLTEEVENADGEPYFYRNVMKKVSTKKKKETLAARAENIKQKLFLGNETMEFLEYVDCEYEHKLSKRALSSFRKNKERDLAIIALLLASGVRLSEAVNLDLKDVNLNMMIIEVTRKGGKHDSVNVTPHKLRHTLATRLYDATKSQVLVSHQLGHASTQVTDLYTHIVNDEQKNALDKL